MNLLARILAPSAPKILKRTTLRDPDGWLYDALAGGGPTVSGTTVSVESATTLASYFAGLRCLSEDCGKLPFKVYERQADGGREEHPKHPAYRLLHDSPNPEMNAISFREFLTSQALGWGNGYAFVDRTPDGKPQAMWPILARYITIARSDAGNLVYILRSHPSHANTIFRSDQIFHLHGLGSDGLGGYSIAHLARESIGLALAAEASGAALFGSGSMPSGVLEHPGHVGDEGAEEYLRSFHKQYGGAVNQRKLLMLGDGMKFHSLTLPGKDTQWLESRTFAVEEMARWFRVPPQKLQHTRDANRASSEQLALEYVIDGLMPWLVRWEQEANKKLLLAPDGRLFAEHSVDGLLRGDTAARWGAYSIAHDKGLMTTNEIRRRENLPSVGSDGDELLLQSQMITLSAVVNPPPAPEPAPTPVAEPVEDDDMNEEDTSRLIEAKLSPIEQQLRTAGLAVEKVSDALSEITETLTEQRIASETRKVADDASAAASQVQREADKREYMAAIEVCKRDIASTLAETAQMAEKYAADTAGAGEVKAIEQARRQAEADDLTKMRAAFETAVKESEDARRLIGESIAPALSRLTSRDQVDRALSAVRNRWDKARREFKSILRLEADRHERARKTTGFEVNKWWPDFRSEHEFPLKKRLDVLVSEICADLPGMTADSSQRLATLSQSLTREHLGWLEETVRENGSIIGGASEWNGIAERLFGEAVEQLCGTTIKD